MPTATSKLTPCIWFDDQAEAATRFYTRLFPEGRVTATLRYPSSFDNPSGKPRGSVATVAFEIAGQRFIAVNGGPMFTLNPSVSFFVRVESPAEADRLYAVLADGGEPLMPLGSYPWSERYGWIKDRFGVSWQVIAGRLPPGGATLVPCLMFAGPQHGKAEAAMRSWTKDFPDGRIESLERYAPGEGPEGTVKHGRFFLAGQELIAMDSHVSHGITFNEALSLMVSCADQAEIDRTWEALCEGGKPGTCGWLTDRFGFAWQVVPEALFGWLQSPDVPTGDRLFVAMGPMTKLDLAALQRAFDGR